MFGWFRLLIPLFLQSLHNLRTIQNKEHEQKRREQASDKIKVWSELDINLLAEIMGRLCLTDRARFRAVCKNWLAVYPIFTAKSPLPWFFCFDRLLPTVSNMLQFRFYDPMSGPNLASVHNISLTKLRIPSPFFYEDIGAFIERDWLVIIICRPRLYPGTRRYFLLFSPFTKKIITLPELDYPSGIRFHVTFSAEPDTPNGVFFLSNITDAGKIVVITYRNGDSKWIAREFDKVADFVSCCCVLVYFRGILYIVSPLGQIASYNIANGEFKFENLVVDLLFSQNYHSPRIHKVFELNGELMLIYFGSGTKYNTTFPGKQCIKMYDWSNKVWIPVSTLGDKTLFVSSKFYEVAAINNEDMRNNGVLSNKIYRFSDCGCVIYSIEDGELVEFKSMISSNLLENYNCDISSNGRTNPAYWLIPPRVRY